MMSRRTFLRCALAALAGPAALAAAGCGAGKGVEQPAKYSERPAEPPAAGVKAKSRNRGMEPTGIE
jgi:hypothetical protein